MPPWDAPRTALITGITGQDGGYLAEQLVQRGASVHGLVRTDEKVPAHLVALADSVTLHEVDLSSEDSLRTVMRAVAPKAVFNLVGVSSVAQSWEDPAGTVAVNGLFVTRLLHLLWQFQEESSEAIRFVQASSGEIFAAAGESPQTEATAIAPASPYGASKALAHAMVRVFRRRGMHASNAILYNHESPRRPLSFVTRKISTGVAAIAQGRASVLTLGNLDTRRDWGWAPEYVDAMIRMAMQGNADDYILATGEAHTVREFVAAAFAHVGIQDWERLVIADASLTRPVDAAELVGVATHAGRSLGWWPTVKFADVVRRMVDADLEA